MAEAAIGIAAAAIDFYSFAHKLFKNAVEIYKDAKGLTAFERQLNAVCDSFRAECDQIASSSPARRDSDFYGNGLTGDDAALKSLALEGKKVADELQAVLRKLVVKIGDGGRASKFFDTGAKAVKLWMNSDEIKELEKRFNRVRDQLNAHILSQVRTSHAEMEKVLRNVQVTSIASRADTASIQTTLHQIQADLETQIRAACQGQRTSQEAMDLLLSKQRLADTEQRHLAIMSSLEFRDRIARDHEIKPPHGGTYDWLVTCHETLRNWLSTGEGLFWIAGKPGSGKSTLMKHIAGHETAQELLQEWAARTHSRLIVATFYFKSAGTEEQKGEEGLLRSLLFQILEAAPDAMQAIKAQKWSESAMALRSSLKWSIEELKNALSAVLDWLKPTTRFCFFIDGLDEFDGGQDDAQFHVLVEELESISKSTVIKICVSSRPRPTFTRAYGGRSDHNLVMQEVTRSDIEKYIHTNFTEYPAVALYRTSHRVDVIKLADEIRDRAEGVFLWVELVIRTAQNLLEQQYPWEEVLEQIRSMPGKLEDFYECMLRRVTHFSKQMAARVLLLNLTASEPLPVLAFEYFGHSITDANFLASIPNGPAESRQLEHYHAQYVAKLPAVKSNILLRAGEFVEFRCVPGRNCGKMDCEFIDQKVVFIHRTAREFLERRTNHLLQLAGPNFDRNETLCAMHVCMTKTLSDDARNFSSGGSHFFEYAAVALDYAREREVEGHATISLILELDRIGQDPPPSTRFQPAHWSELSKNWRSWDWPEDQYGILAVAACRSMDKFVLEQLEGQQGMDRGKVNVSALLDCSLREVFLHPIAGSDKRRPNVKLVEGLLKKGADPNTRLLSSRKESVWEFFFKEVVLSDKVNIRQPDEWQGWFDVQVLPTVKLLLAAGADAGIRVEGMSPWAYMREKIIAAREDQCNDLEAAFVDSQNKECEIETLCQKSEVSTGQGGSGNDAMGFWIAREAGLASIMLGPIAVLILIHRLVALVEW